MKRRILTAIVLYGFALGLAFFRNGGGDLWLDLATNIFLATLGLFGLHLRWRMQEKDKITPKQVKDTFS